MKNYFFYLTFLAHVAFPMHSAAQTPKWHYLGDTTISDEYSQGALMALYEGTPYVAFGGNCGTGLSTIVKRFNGTDWGMLDTAGLGETHYQGLGISSSGKPQLAYFENNKFGLKHLENNVWKTVSESPQMPGSPYHISYAFDDENLFVAFTDSDLSGQISVWKFDGSDWSVVGQPFVSPGGLASIILKISVGTPWLAYLEPNSSKACVVKKFDGIDWQSVGGPVFIGTFTHQHNPFVYHTPNIDFAVSNGVPFIVYTDSTTLYRVSVLKFDGNVWAHVGEPMFTVEDGSAVRIAIDSDDNVPYVLFKDLDLGISGTSVMRFDGNTWNYVGNRVFSSFYLWSAIFEIQEGIPFFAYEPSLFCPKVSVLAFSQATQVKEPKRFEISFSISQNPVAGDVLKMKIQSGKESDVVTQISTMEGRVMLENGMHLDTGAFEHQINVGSLANGVYVIQLKSKDGLDWSTKRFVVAR